MTSPRPSGKTPNPRRPRLTDAETAERVLAAAVGRLESEGITVSFDRLGMERAIADAGVSRASAYRRWPTRQDFLVDVLVAAVTKIPPEAETEDEIRVLSELVASRRDDLASPQGRRDLVVEALRLLADLDIRRLLASRRWQNHLALAATHRGLPEGPLKASVGRAIAEAEERMLGRRAEAYSHLPRLLGYRLVPPLAGAEGFRIMSSAAGVTMTGILLRSHADPAWLDDRRTLRPFGSSRDAAWSMPELHLVGAFLAHLEPDPDLIWDADRIAASLGLMADRVDAARAARDAAEPAPLTPMIDG